MAAPDETIIHSGHLHYIILVKAFLWLVFFVCMAFYIPNIFWNSGAPDFVLGYKYLISTIQNYDIEWNRIFNITETFTIIMGLLSLMLGLIVPLYYLKMYFSRYIVVTDNRLIYKTGLLFIHIMEIEIDEIEEVHLNSGLLGGLLDYGYIYVDMRFVGDANIPCVPKPYLFMQSLHKAHDNKHDDVNVIWKK